MVFIWSACSALASSAGGRAWLSGGRRWTPSCTTPSLPAPPCPCPPARVRGNRAASPSARPAAWGRRGQAASPARAGARAGSSLVAGPVVRLAAGGGGEEVDQRDRGLGAEGGFRGAHLAIAVVHAPLQRDQLAGRDAIGRPGRDHRPRRLWLVEHRQLLHADTLAFVAVAAGAGEVPGADAMEVNGASEHGGGFLLRMLHTGGDPHAARLRGDIGGQGLEFRRAVGAPEHAAGRLLAAAALERRHAVEKPRLEVHDRVGILEVTRQVGVGAFQHARAFTEITVLQGHVLRPLGLFPERLALQLEELGGAALGDHLPIALDLAGAVLCLRQRRARRRGGEGREPHATAASVLFDSPWLSSQLTSILSPLAPPFSRKENTGLRDTAWLICASTTVRPLTLTVRFWMKCIGTSLPSGSLRCPVSIGWFMSTRMSV